MSNHGSKRSPVRNDHLHESIQLYLRMQKATTEAEFAALLAQHDACTDADGKPRLFARTLDEFRRGPGPGPSTPGRTAGP